MMGPICPIKSILRNFDQTVSSHSQGTQHQPSRVKHSTLGKETMGVVDIHQQPSPNRLGDHISGNQCIMKPQGTHEPP
ncbi:hypothetical protein Landi51_01880 [Colletotrichum acutatum]